MDTLRFAVIGDLHVGTTSDAVQTVIRLVNGMDVDFALFLGDLVHTPEDAHVREFVEQVRRFNKPVYLTIGNHDTASAEQGYDIHAAIAAGLPGPWSESFTYGFEAKGWRFIVGGISTMSIAYKGPQINHFKNYVSESGGTIYMPEADLESFLRLLEESGDQPTCVVMHPPLVRMAPRIRRRGCFAQVRLLEEPGLWSVIYERPNVKLLLYGHDHFNQVDEVDGKLHCITQGVRGYPPYKDADAIRLVEIAGGTVRSHMVWEGRDGQAQPGPLGTLEGDQTFEWSFAKL